MKFFTRLARLFSSAGRRAASLTHQAMDLLEEILPILFASGLADAGLSDAARRDAAKAFIRTYAKEKYPGLPSAVIDIAVGLAFDALRNAIRDGRR